MFSKIRNPFMFQGSLRKKNYFEGWYFKMVTKDQRYTLALIPGISLNPNDSHAFIQVFITKMIDEKKTIKTNYIEYDSHDFHFDKKTERLDIKDSHFFENKLNININKQDTSITGEIVFSNLKPLKKTLFSPSIMGFFAYIKFMECYHGVVSLNHLLDGKLVINHELIDFTGGKGYIEKDWGKSFPEAYIWLQSNHFQDKNTSIMFSYATIPFMKLRFKGLIMSLYLKGKEYRFATYNFARIKKHLIEKNHIIFIIKKRSYTIELEAWNQETIELKSPRKGSMKETIKEGLSGEVKIKLYRKNELIYNDIGTNAGLEIMMS